MKILLEQCLMSIICHIWLAFFQLLKVKILFDFSTNELLVSINTSSRVYKITRLSLTNYQNTNVVSWEVFILRCQKKTEEPNHNIICKKNSCWINYMPDRKLSIAQKQPKGRFCARHYLLKQISIVCWSAINACALEGSPKKIYSFMSHYLHIYLDNTQE